MEGRAGKAAECQACALTAEVFKALAHPLRVSILTFLGGDEHCVCEVVSALSLQQPTASKHLAILHAGGLIERRRDGARVLYRVRPGVLELLNRAHELAVERRQAEAALWFPVDVPTKTKI